jgi:hypothetical protein
MFRDLNNNHIGIYVEDELHLLVLSYLHVLQSASPIGEPPK